jgi:hypothetical protein
MNGQWRDWFKAEEFRVIAMRQRNATGGSRAIEWHFAEKEVADAVRPLVDDLVDVVHTPLTGG